MEKYIYLLLIVLFCFNSTTTSAQHHYNVRLIENPSTGIGEICYYLQLASADGVDLNLAGQNYRMYYDASKLQYNINESSSLLPNQLYTKLVVKDNIIDIDATGSGPLPFDNHLSFLNIGNDLKDEGIGGIVLPASGDWMNTANVCFTKIENENSIELTKDYSIYWARPELTESYATAYVQVAEWIEPDVTKPAKAANYIDQELSTSIEENFGNQSLKVYPSPARDRIFINSNTTKKLSIQLFTMTGQLVVEDTYPPNQHQHAISVKHLAAGVYQLRLNGGQQQILKKIEKID